MCMSNPCTRICTWTRPTPAHIYAHVHVQPLHTYMCMSNPCTHICTWTRPTPAHIYTHVHVQPLHTYIHMCTSNRCTHICTHARPHVFPPAVTPAAGAVPRMRPVCRGPSGPSPLTGAALTLLPALGLSSEARDEQNRPAALSLCPPSPSFSASPPSCSLPSLFLP